MTMPTKNSQKINFDIKMFAFYWMCLHMMENEERKARGEKKFKMAYSASSEVHRFNEVKGIDLANIASNLTTGATKFEILMGNEEEKVNDFLIRNYGTDNIELACAKYWIED